jgi:hypothetical protein
MPRSTTTGIYTRVDNSFSNPVTGTTINPTDADSFFDDIDAAMNGFLGTSTTSLLIETGAKSFTTQTAKSFLVGMFVQAFSQADHANYMYGSVTSYNSGTGALVVEVTAVGGSGTLNDWLLLAAGAQGATGSTGSTGATGATSGIKQTYSTTTADADPGAGVFRLNHATPASATAAYLDNADAAAATVSTIIDLWDDSTTTTKGYLRFEKSTDPTVWAQFAVTGSVVDGTGYRKVTLGSGAGSGAFSNGDTFAITFYRTGDKGSDGVGTGDVVGPASATDRAIARWDTGTGKLLQDSVVTIADTTGLIAGSRFANTGLKIEDTNASHLLTIAAGSNITADRTLTLTTGDADRSLTLTANSSIGGTAAVVSGNQTVTGGFNVTATDAGTKSSGTFTPAPATNNFQYAINGGAHTLAPPTNDCTMVVQYTNNASAGAITTSGFTKVTGDSFTTTNGHDFFCFITRCNAFSHLHVTALQ